MPPSQCPPLDYGKLFSNPVPPFPSIMWIISPAQLIQALVGSSTAQYLVLLNNMSVSAADWAVALPAASTAPGSSSNNSSSNMSGTSGADPPPGLASVSLSRSITLSGWPGVMTVLDWQGMADQLLLTSAASLTLRNLVIMNGAPQSAPALAQTLVKPELAPYTGPFILHRDQLSLTLQQAVQVVLWPAAFNAVKQVSGFHSMPQVPGNALPPELMVYSSALGEASFLGVDVTLLSLAAGDAALGLPYPSLPPPIAASLPKALPTGIDTQTSAADKAIVAKLGLLVGLLPAFILTGVGCWAWWAQRKEQLATTAPVTDAEASLEADTRAGVQAELPRAPHDPGVIGQGAFGVVYKGTWKGLTVAVKTLVFTALPSMPVSKRQQRAMTEAAICRTMQHPNIVATYAYDLQVLHAASGGSGTLGSSQCSPAHSGGPGPSLSPLEPLKHPTEFKVYIIQEFCDGGTLTAAVDGGMLEDMTADQPQPIMAHVLQLATDIAAGMAHVHSRNVVHGDLTPSNILLRAARSTLSGYVAKVAGFGLSWKLTGGQEHVSNARQGTACYIAPEVMHTGIMSKPADVFSFGMLLHEMYHGTPPWRLVKQRDVGSSRTRHADAAKAARLYPGVQSMHWAPTCPPEFRLLTEACLASNPQERPTFFVIVEKLLALQQALRQAASQAMGLPTP
ncbi:protein kinase domain-containing protein, partial [Haematococcus lacustris]